MTLFLFYNYCISYEWWFLLFVCQLAIIPADLGIDGVEVAVVTPDVHHLAVAADRRGRGHAITGWKAQDLAAGHCIDGVESRWPSG